MEHERFLGVAKTQRISFVCILACYVIGHCCQLSGVEGKSKMHFFFVLNYKVN